MRASLLAQGEVGEMERVRQRATKGREERRRVMRRGEAALQIPSNQPSKY